MMRYNNPTKRWEKMRMFKILIVEDDAELNRQVCNYLRLNGYETTGCLSANDAFCSSCCPPPTAPSPVPS